MTAASGSLQEHGKGSVLGCKSKTLFCLLTYLSESTVGKNGKAMCIYEAGGEL